MQFYGRAWFRLARPRADLSAAPPLRKPGGTWQEVAHRTPSLTAPQEFLFLGVKGALQEVGWDGEQREKLWRYNQHYFDDLNAIGASTRATWHGRLLEQWVQDNPPARGNGWEPYPTSLRIVNWVKWAAAGNALPPECIHSLAIQARWLAKRLEIHLLGNHLFANAKALVFAGAFFEGPEADQWRALGLSILAREVPEQILADGGHFERSTMYHALALEDMLDLCNLVATYPQALSANQKAVAANWQQLVPRMHECLHTLCHPDGEIGFFNDAAMGIAPAPEELDAYASRMGLAGSIARAEESRLLASSGYLRLAAPGAVALVDAAPVGPDYLPGHAHADTLSFELSVRGQRLLVNSGTSVYGLGAERLRQRGTAAHNTVTVDGADSSEVWGGFRVARRARVHDVQANLTSMPLSAVATHDGYTRLAGKPLHQRQWEMTAGQLVVTDTIHGLAKSAEGRFHFHPEVIVALDAAKRTVLATLPDGSTVQVLIERGEARLEPSTWHPRFGESLPNVCLCVRLQHGAGRVRVQWD